MALSSIIKQTCDQCGKIAVEKSRISFGSSKLISLECGHVITENVMTSSGVANILNGCTLWPYQVAGVEFLERANGRALLADEQGLGKTIQAMALIKLHRAELTPAIIVAPTSVKLQWHHEFLEKCGVEGFLTQVISSGKEMAAPGFDIYVTTYDLIKNDKCFDFVKDNIKLVVIDECQRIKNHLSGRAKAIQKLCKNVEHIIPLSGTPIKNHAGEYFTVLNLIAPRSFPHYATFIERECDSYHNGYGYKVGGLRNPAAFHEKTKDFVLRRTKDEVLKDLPSLSRKFFHCELDKRLNKVYADALQELEDLYYKDDDESNAFTRNSSMIAIMTKMRQVTGIGKVEQCVDFVTEFLLSNERKIVVFAHHHAAVNMLLEKLNGWLADGGFKPCLNLHSGLSGDDRQRLIETFRDTDHRVMIASTLAAGEGLNLQFCADAVMLERQWNPANEEQAEGRFHRFGQTYPVSITYMIASETIDEYFTELVESKRAIVASTMDNKEIQWDQSSLMSELANILVTKGKKAWSLK
jgi:SWI/SNF-related matrix-associated actin-dependent regulator of chromatin subfamily A-like protein 1